MSNTKQKPIYRAKFAPIVGIDEHGKDRRGAMNERARGMIATFDAVVAKVLAA